MSGFRVKILLRGAILTDNFYFINDVELIQFLKTVHADDQQNYFKHFSSDNIEATCKEKGNGIKIPSCRKSCMILLFPDGSWQVKRYMCSCHFCKIGKFNNCIGKLSNHVISDKENIDDDPDLLDNEYNSEMYVFAIENFYVALYSAPKSLHSFYLMKVLE